MIEDGPDTGAAVQRRWGSHEACLRGPWTAICRDMDGFPMDTSRIEAWALNEGHDADPSPAAIGVIRGSEVDPGGFGDVLFTVVVNPAMSKREVVAAWWRAKAIAQAMSLRA